MTSFDQSADVVVVGSGCAGLTAAFAASEGGASVIVLERGEEPGGTTARSGGAYWVPNNFLMHAAGLDDPRDDALALMARLSYPSFYDREAPRFGLASEQLEMLETVYDTGAVPSSMVAV